MPGDKIRFLVDHPWGCRGLIGQEVVLLEHPENSDSWITYDRNPNSAWVNRIKYKGMIELIRSKPMLLLTEE